MKITDDMELMCTSCGHITKAWPDGYCPQCGTEHQPLVIRRDKPETKGVKIYIDRNDWWVGYYRGIGHHYVCPFPTVVIRWRRK